MFSVGDEVECVDDSSEPIGPWPFRKGATFTVQGFWREGETIDGLNSIRGCDAVAIGFENTRLRNNLESFSVLLPHYDIWDAARFRKVERKRTREELYALIGISAGQNGTVRVLETVDA